MEKQIIWGRALFQFILVIVLLTGWGLNLYKFASSDFETPYKSEIIRGVAIPIVIVGAVAGYMDIGDEN